MKKYEDILSLNEGKKLSDDQKSLIIKVYLNYKLMHSNFTKKINDLNQEVSYLCGISVSTLRNIKLQYEIDLTISMTKCWKIMNKI